ncbi:hydantoinase/oxoprolinase family protein, partial [Bordetella hinzii]|nr:hydantoinase/oxoprolinase family protein [Bordetella hinzii]
MAYRVGVDIGGSFTDFAVLDAADNTIRTLKVLSRPDQPGAEVIQGLGILGERDGIAPAEVEYFTHGTTVGVNTVIQRSGARLALFTTRNFEDVLELARLKMPNFHNLYARRPAPLVSRDRVFPVDERIDASGAVLQAIDEASLRQALRGAREARCEGIVLAFLHAYRNPANEAAARALLQEWAPEMPVCAASEIWPIIREYERTVT